MNITIEKVEDIFKGRKPRAAGKCSSYAVLVPLVDKDGQIHVLFEVRSDSLKRQPGEVCFPGGRIESGETPQGCAVRETAEELNVARKQIHVISGLDYIHTYGNFTLYPFLGEIKYEAVRDAKINTDEVKEIFLVPLRFFTETEPFVYRYRIVPEVGKDFPYEKIGFSGGYNWRSGKSDVSIYEYENRIIWGISGAIIKNTAEIIRAYAGV